MTQWKINMFYPSLRYRIPGSFGIHKTLYFNEVTHGAGWLLGEVWWPEKNEQVEIPWLSTPNQPWNFHENSQRSSEFLSCWTHVGRRHIPVSRSDGVLQPFPRVLFWSLWSLKCPVIETNLFLWAILVDYQIRGGWLWGLLIPLGRAVGVMRTHHWPPVPE